MAPPDLSLERTSSGRVAGVDEAGRGPWAGPVVAAAVILPVGPGQALAEGLDDSKKLSPSRREQLYALLRDQAEIGVGAASVPVIDRMNILRATHLAMRCAVQRLQPDLALIDGNSLPDDLPCPARAIIGGDGKSLSIAAASIIAKVTRDRIMAALAGRYPGFGWERNAGYGTRQHQESLNALGPTPHHRRTFAPVARIIARNPSDS